MASRMTRLTILAREIGEAREFQRYEISALKNKKLRRHLIQPWPEEYGSDHLSKGCVATHLYVTVAGFSIPPVAAKIRGVKDFSSTSLTL